MMIKNNSIKDKILAIHNPYGESLSRDRVESMKVHCAELAEEMEKEYIEQELNLSDRLEALQSHYEYSVRQHAELLSKHELLIAALHQCQKDRQLEHDFRVKLSGELESANAKVDAIIAEIKLDFYTDETSLVLHRWSKNETR